MEINPIDVRLVHNKEPLLAFASITLDDSFIIHGFKVIRGNTGLFVSMPQNRVQDVCPACTKKNSLQSRFCHWCGAPLAKIEERSFVQCPNPECGENWPQGWNVCGKCESKLPEKGLRYENICAATTPEFREQLQLSVLRAYMKATGGVT